MKPSFINVEHTSMSLSEKSKYNNPDFNKNKNNEIKKRRGGWDDEEEEDNSQVTKSKIPITYFKKDNNNKTKSATEENSSNIAKQDDIKTNNTEHSSPIDNKPSYNIDIEKQLLDNILISTSITTKPSDLQLKDYLNRSKNLNKSNIIHNLRSKLELFINNKNTKGVIKCLYLIEFSINNKINEIKDYFKKNKNIIEELKNEFKENKKILEICDSILVLTGCLKKLDIKKNDISKKEQLNSFLNKNKTKNYNNQHDTNIKNLNNEETSNKENCTTIPDDIFGLTTENIGYNNDVNLDINNIIDINSYNPSTNAIENKTNNDEKKDKISNFSFVKNKKESNIINKSNNKQETINEEDNILDFNNINYNKDSEVKKGFSFINKKKEQDSINNKLKFESNKDAILSELSNIDLNSSANLTNNNIDTKKSNIISDNKNDLNDLLNQAYNSQKNINPNYNNQYISPTIGGYSNCNYQINMNDPSMNSNNNFNSFHLSNSYNYGIYNNQINQNFNINNLGINSNYNNYSCNNYNSSNINTINNVDKSESYSKKDDKYKDKFNFIDDLMKPKKK